jgi:hypothetical protein
MPKAAKIVCKPCGLAMNRHAEKLERSVGPDETRHVDPDLGGVVREVHTCPGCGGSATRKAFLPTLEKGD